MSASVHPMPCLALADEDVLTLKSLREQLERSDSPFLPSNNSGGGFGAGRGDALAWLCLDYCCSVCALLR